ncbi:uncharacterized protein LAJ45_03285 [Morchella importuna]|uniref:uncharacterized protein n=1 Tax=Morchella importuna TaxID=1174673 RepID=UPI001E8ED8A2|nr:uncharacterized protein LAJ45_03285 [Morchella importuna]KAH8152445.1 hypothetical protein LAJ45_03285 [Morchella importuna]
MAMMKHIVRSAKTVVGFEYQSCTFRGRPSRDLRFRGENKNKVKPTVAPGPPFLVTALLRRTFLYASHLIQTLPVLSPGKRSALSKATATIVIYEGKVDKRVNIIRLIRSNNNISSLTSDHQLQKEDI